MRMIDGDAVLADFHNAMCADCQDECAACQWRDAIKLIENAPTVGSWISVKDRLPETSGPVITLLHYGTISVHDYSAKWKAFNAHDSSSWESVEKYNVNNRVAYWLPIDVLPDVPNEVADDADN